MWLSEFRWGVYVRPSTFRILFFDLYYNIHLFDLKLQRMFQLKQTSKMDTGLSSPVVLLTTSNHSV